mgnify:CR=1 FL=1
MNALERLQAIEASMTEQIRLANGQGKDTARATERLTWLRKSIATDLEWLGNVAALYEDVAISEPTAGADNGNGVRLYTEERYEGGLRWV